MNERQEAFERFNQAAAALLDALASACRPLLDLLARPLGPGYLMPRQMRLTMQRRKIRRAAARGIFRPKA